MGKLVRCRGVPNPPKDDGCQTSILSSKPRIGSLFIGGTVPGRWSRRAATDDHRKQVVPACCLSTCTTLQSASRHCVVRNPCRYSRTAKPRSDSLGDVRSTSQDPTGIEFRDHPAWHIGEKHSTTCNEDMESLHPANWRS